MSHLSGTYVIWGPPGTGKTRFLAEQVDKIVQETPVRVDGTGPVVVSSLTRAAASEIASRKLPIPGWQVGTLHALAYRMLGRPPIAETLVEEWNKYRPEYAIEEDSASDDVDDMPVEHGTDRSTRGRNLYAGTDLYSEYTLLRAQVQERDTWKPTVRRFAAAWEDWKKAVGCIDFSDMIELALKDVRVAPGNPDVILLDEAQDLSSIERELVLSWSKHAEAAIFAGDSWQALYVWRGADPSIFTDPSIPETHRRVLSQSYRVPRLVQDLSMRWVRNLSDYSPIEYKARDEEGELLTSDANWTKPEPLMDVMVRRLEAGETVMVCATCSYMLRPMVQVLRKHGIPFCNPWRTKRRDWNPLRASRGVSVAQRILDFLRVDAASFPKDAEQAYMRGRFWNYDELRNWASILKAADLMQRGAKGLLNRWAIEKKHVEVWPDDMWKVFTEVGGAGLAEALGLDEGKTEAMLAWLQEHLLDSRRKAVHYPVEVVRRFGVETVVDNMRPGKDDGKPHVYVGTIHSFKGSEADNLIIFPDLSPAGYASWRSAKDRDGVVRTFYVGITRAKKTVTVCQAGGQFKVQLMGLIDEVLAK